MPIFDTSQLSPELKKLFEQKLKKDAKLDKLKKTKWQNTNKKTNTNT